MNTNELRELLKEVFYEDEYKISETDYIKYDEELTRFNIKVYSKKMNKHMVMIVIQNYIIGTTICKDIWEMIWSLPNQNYYMKIPGTSIKRNPKDVGNPKFFLMLSKDKINDILLINKLNNTLMDDMVQMDKNSLKMVRDYKLKKLGIEYENYIE
jgi:hypothetical protein